MTRTTSWILDLCCWFLPWSTFYPYPYAFQSSHTLWGSVFGPHKDLSPQEVLKWVQTRILRRYDWKTIGYYTCVLLPSNRIIRGIFCWEFALPFWVHDPILLKIFFVKPSSPNKTMESLENWRKTKCFFLLGLFLLPSNKLVFGSSLKTRFWGCSFGKRSKKDSGGKVQFVWRRHKQQRRAFKRRGKLRNADTTNMQLPWFY